MNVRREKLAEETARLPQKAPADDVLQGKTAADAVAAASPAEENRIWRLLVAEIRYSEESRAKGAGIFCSTFIFVSFLRSLHRKMVAVHCNCHKRASRRCRPLP